MDPGVPAGLASGESIGSTGGGTLLYESPAIAADQLFDRIGVHWTEAMTSADQIAFDVRTSSDGAVWSEEQILAYFPRLKERMDVAADYLSGGEQQMVAVARAMSGNVRLLLLDEPFEGLAPAVTLDLFKVFDRLRQQLSIVIVEHNLDLVLALADRVFALERGAVFHTGPASPLLTDLDYRKTILWL
jgi:ABC-type branched-subunit amino acid transport system ATPase component